MTTRSGILRTWHDDRGFGFIAPTQGGRELFVHISAFPQDGSRPAVGETLQFELGPGKDGKVQALRVRRLAFMGGEGGSPVGANPSARAERSAAGARLQSERRLGSSSVPSVRPRAGSGAWRRAVFLVLLLSAAAFGYQRFQGWRAAEPVRFAVPVTEAGAEPVLESFRCDGRTHCSEMKSCAEARYFLRNCPGVQMDGDGDGIPCELQWCR